MMYAYCDVFGNIFMRRHFESKPGEDIVWIAKGHKSALARMLYLTATDDSDRRRVPGTLMAAGQVERYLAIGFYLGWLECKPHAGVKVLLRSIQSAVASKGGRP